MRIPGLSGMSCHITDEVSSLRIYSFNLSDFLIYITGENRTKVNIKFKYQSRGLHIHPFSLTWELYRSSFQVYGWLPVCLPERQSLPKIRSTPKEKNLLQWEQILTFMRWRRYETWLLIGWLLVFYVARGICVRCKVVHFERWKREQEH